MYKPQCPSLRENQSLPFFSFLTLHEIETFTRETFPQLKLIDEVINLVILFENSFWSENYANVRWIKWRFFFNCYLAVPGRTLGHSRGDSLTNPMLITAFVQFRPEGHREPRNEVGCKAQPSA